MRSLVSCDLWRSAVWKSVREIQTLWLRNFALLNKLLLNKLLLKENFQCSTTEKYKTLHKSQYSAPSCSSSLNSAACLFGTLPRKKCLFCRSQLDCVWNSHCEDHLWGLWDMMFFGLLTSHLLPWWICYCGNVKFYTLIMDCCTSGKPAEPAATIWWISGRNEGKCEPTGSQDISLLWLW